MSRLYVSNLPEIVLANDLKLLFEKICPVNDVHVPTKTYTGIVRNFAIILLDGGEDDAKKCIKSFNRCHWKGVKLEVEMSKKEYYKDKLAKEKLDDAKQVMNDEDISNVVISVPIMKKFEQNVLKIRKVRDIDPLTVSVVPYSKRAPIRNESLLYCLHRRFGETTEDDETLDMIVSSAKTQIALQISKAIIGRKGFGTLLSKSIKPKESDSEGIVPKNFGMEDSSSEVSDHEEYHENDNDESNPMDIKHLNSNEILIDMKKDQQRSLNLLSSMLSADYMPTTDHLESIQATRIPNLPMPTKKHLGSIIIPRYDPTKLLKQENKPQEIIETVVPKEHLNNKVETQSPKEIILPTQTVIIPQIIKNDTNLETFTDLNELKSIFHQDGGVWFGNDGTLNEEVKKGNIITDRMFIEAEKLGIDIRTQDNTQQENKSMMFSFFNEPETVVSKPTVVNNNGSNNSMTLKNEETVKPLESYYDDIELFKEEEQLKLLRNSMLLSNIVRQAKMFQRDK